MRSTQRLSPSQLDQYASRQASRPQLEALAKMTRMGWRITAVLVNAGVPEISLGTKDQAVWLHPDGSVTRPKAGARCARL